MMTMYDVIVVGGGLAGCSAAIHLAQRGIKVLLLERDHYPKHKICGEFLSTEVGELLGRLGLSAPIGEAGATQITNVRITASNDTPWEASLPGSAIGLSRFALDLLLFQHASDAGVDALFESVVLSISGSLVDGFVVETVHGSYKSRVVLGAYGKKSGLDVTLGRPVRTWASGYVAYKQHFRGIPPAETVEVHLFDRGYCGINAVEGGVTNVCWLAERSLLDRYGGDRKALSAQQFASNRWLSERMDGLTEVPGTLCAIGSVTLAHKGFFARDVCLIGDTTQMIAPFCGDGMAMALRTGEMIAPICLDFLSGKLGRQEFFRTYERAWKIEFSSRLRIGKILQDIALAPSSAARTLTFLHALPAVGRALIRSTRGDGRNSRTHPSIVNPGPKASAIPKA